jgi:hypothetical protein
MIVAKTSAIVSTNTYFKVFYVAKTSAIVSINTYFKVFYAG